MNMFNLIPTITEFELGDCGAGCSGCEGCYGCKGERKGEPDDPPI